MIKLPKSVSLDEFLQRIGSEPNGNIWSVFSTSSSDFQQLVNDLEDTLSIFTECEVGCLSADKEVSILVEQINETTEDYLILWNFEQWDKNNWYQFDCHRSELKKKKGVVLILSPQSAKTMFSYAPNIASWIGSRVYNFLKDAEILTEEEIEQRLAALREWSGLTDSQVIEMAEQRTLPTDPEYGEWLVLLNRGDLIVQ
ncbi:MAG TPA: hypothetical protein VK203_12500 [Nostocaceae cyanobacterium]|nr:hypothetical protein [Nostocaceae cyanobacterium]